MTSTPHAIARAAEHFTSGRLQQAAAVLDAHFRTGGCEPAAHNLAAIVHAALGALAPARYHASEAVRRRGAAIDHAAMARMELAAGNLDAAAASLDRVVTLEPANHLAWTHLGEIHASRARLAASEQSFEAALDAAPTFTRARVGLTSTLITAGRPADAVSMLRAFLGATPPGRPRDAALEQGLAFALNYLDPNDASPDDVAAAHRAFGATIAVRFPARPAPADKRDPARRLRLAYLSPDFRAHAVSYFIEGVLRRHDRARFEVFALSTHPPDARTDALRPLADEWRDVANVHGAALAEACRADRIDILVDLAGLTTGGRLPALSLRCAPLQVTWLGYPHTTGLPSVDARLVDAVTDPPGAGADARSTERLVRLPGCFMCYTPPDDGPDVAPPPALRSGSITFGSFNPAPKISPATIRLWSRVLAAVPRSRLVLKAGAFAEEVVRVRFARAFADAGVDDARLELRSHASSFTGHLAQFADVDIALDPLPYSGATTTCESLWMGVPVVTLPGASHASRVAASLLTAAGLPEFIATSADDFVAIASELATDLDRLPALRAGMRSRLSASPLLEAASFTRSLEEALFAAWARVPAADQPG